MQKLALVFILTIFKIATCTGQEMLGKSTDDILGKYKSNPNYLLVKLRVPDGVVMPPIKITHTIDMTKTGNSENTIITFKIKPYNYIQNFILVSDKCIQYDTYYNIKSLYTTLDKLNSKDIPLKQDENVAQFGIFIGNQKMEHLKLLLQYMKLKKTMR